MSFVLLPCLLNLLLVGSICTTLLVDGQRVVELPQDSNKTQKEKASHKACDVRSFKIKGNIYSLPNDDLATLRSVLVDTKILINYGQLIAFPSEDGSFEVTGLTSESYIVEASHPMYVYEPMRVDITSKGKIRARRVNYIQPSLVQTLDYPLSFRPKGIYNYFIPRETWRITDILLNPMVILMVVPLVIIWLLPKMMNPQEVQAQRESIPEYNVPELSEMITSVFGGPTATAQGITAISSGKGHGSGSSSGSKSGKVKKR